MKFSFKERNEFSQVKSVFGKLFLSHIIVAITVTVIVGVVSYLFFASRYNREVEKVHQKALEQVTDTLRFRIIEPATQSFLDLASYYSEPSANLLHFNEPLAGHNYKIDQTYEYLRQAVAAHSGMVSAIHIYYKKQGLVISSALGVGLIKENDRNSYKYPDWIHALPNNVTRAIWLEPGNTGINPAPDHKLTAHNVFTFVRIFPSITTGTDYQGIIAVDISEKIIGDLVSETIPSQCRNTFIINEQGRVVSHPQKEMLLRMLAHESYIRRIINSPLIYGSFIQTVNRRRLMVTFTSLQNPKWKLVNLTPIGQFYHSARFIRTLLIVICLLAILIGILLSFVFTRRIYNPLKLIIRKMRLLAAAPASVPQEDEYGFINRFIDEIAVKAQSFRQTETTLQNNLLIDLLYHRFLSEAGLSEALQFLDNTVQSPYYYVIVFQMDAAAFKNRTPEECQRIKNQLTLKISKIEPEKCLGIDLPDGRIVMIAGVKTANSVLINRLVAAIIADALASYQLPITATAGSGVNSGLEIHRSFQEATLLQKYRYFFPELPLICGESFLNKERSQATFPGASITELEDGLRRRDLARIEVTITQLITVITVGDYSANYCQQAVWEIAYIFSLYLREIRYPLTERERSDLEDFWHTTGNIQEFKNWICEFARKVFNWVTDRTGNRNYQIVEKVVQYLSTHLEEDLSLETAGSLVNLSPGYFSKVFKEITGVVFSVYLRDLRIEKAQQLLVETNLPVQKIGYQVGYNTPAYFIKQFKAKSGYTPYDYRRQFQDRTLAT